MNRTIGDFASLSLGSLQDSGWVLMRDSLSWLYLISRGFISVMIYKCSAGVFKRSLRQIFNHWLGAQSAFEIPNKTQVRDLLYPALYTLKNENIHKSQNIIQRHIWLRLVKFTEFNISKFWFLNFHFLILWIWPIWAKSLYYILCIFSSFMV